MFGHIDGFMIDQKDTNALVKHNQDILTYIILL